MTLIERLLSRVFEHVDIEKTVEGKIELYLRRWFILTTKWGNIYLHKIVRSDDDPEPHDHPWNFHSLILKTGYIEEIYNVIEWSDGTKQRLQCPTIRTKPFRLYSRKAEHLHQVKTLGSPAWTLVFLGKYDFDREWGFVEADGTWKFWRIYLNHWKENPYDKTEKQLPKL